MQRNISAPRIRISLGSPLIAMVLATAAPADAQARNPLDDIHESIRLPGTRHEIMETRIIDARASGRPGMPTVIEGDTGGSSALDAGEVIRFTVDTTRNGHRCWIAELPEVRDGKWYFHQLFVNGERRFRPRVPDEGFYRFSAVPDLDPTKGYTPGQKRAEYEPGHFDPEWTNRDDIEIVVLHYWVSPRMRIANIDADQRIVEFTQPTLRRLSDSFNVKQFARYYVDNVYEALDSPGEWYLDRPAGKLYYLPLPGESLDETRVTAPRLRQLLRIEGTPHKPVEHLTLRNITFTGTEWYDADANAADRQSSITVPAVISLKHARHIRIEDCTIQGVGTYGIEIGEGCEHVTIDNCTITDLGAGGIKIGHGSNHTTVTNCEISRGGQLFHNAVGVWIGHTHHNRVAHNRIHHLYYSGMSVGWTWGYRQPSQASHNIVEFNHIHDIGQGWLSDMAGVYTLGVSPGTIVRNNHIHDVQADNYGGWGLYTDEGSSYILMENNVVYRCTDSGFHQHYGSYNVIRNNIFAFGGHAQIMRTREENHCSFIFDRNIIFSDIPAILGGNWKDDSHHLDYNIYWRKGGEPIDFKGQTFEQWQARGHDRHSIVADPLFTNPEHDDFTLNDDSPALKMGFKPIDVSKCGRVVRD